MNQSYLEKETLERIKKHFSKNKMAKLDFFLAESELKNLTQKTISLKFRKTKIPDRFSFSLANTKNINAALFNIFNLTIEKITSKRIKQIQIKKFSHKDYSIIHDETFRGEKSKAIFFITQNWDLKFGGNLALIKGPQSFIITPQNNSLFIYEKENADKEFIQYINHLSRKNHFFTLEFSLKR